MSVGESLSQLLQRIEEINIKVAALGREVIAVGSFQALIDPATDLTWLNYAVPVEPLGDKAEVAEVLEELREVFRERDRTLRFEFTESLWETLPEVLEEAGLQLEVRHPMLLCKAADFQPAQASGVDVRLLTNADHPDILAKYISVRNQGFYQDSAPAPPTEAEIADLQEQIHMGQMRCAMAFLDGIPGGVGVTTTPVSGVCELVGVTTLPALRRRGVATTLCSFLVKEHFENSGDLVWLSAGDAIAKSAYERIGFHVVDARLNYIDATVVNFNFLGEMIA